MSRSFAIFSNRIGEYEIFVRSRTVYWPRSIARPAPSQRREETVDETVGESVYLVSGASIRNHIVEDLRDKVNSSPMITHKGEIVEIIDNPVVCYYYHHGVSEGKKNKVMLPFEMFEALNNFDTFLDQPFTSENRQEIGRILKVGTIVQDLIQKKKIEFVQAYEKGNKFYIRDSTDGLFILDEYFTSISEEDADVGRVKKYQMMPSKSSLLAIRDACTDAGLDGAEVILNLGTWQGNQYMKIQLSENLFQSVKWDAGLPQGISTRLLTDGAGDPLVTKLFEAVENDSVTPMVQKGDKGMEGMVLAKNQILYGPPGTGKTYSVVRKALEIVDPQLCKRLNDENADRKAWMDAYKQYTDNKQVQFCTFHQSYSYEDFVEGLRSDANGNFIPTNGIFLEICKEAEESNQIFTPTYEFDEEQINFYKMSLGRKGTDDIYNYCIENNVISIGYGGALDFSDCNTNEEIKNLIEESYTGTEKKEAVFQEISYFKNSLEVNDIVLVSKGNSDIRAIGRVVGEYKYDGDAVVSYNHFREVEWLYKGASIPVEEVLIGRKFMMRSIYKLDKENLKLGTLQKLISTVEAPLQKKNFVLIMDEINRGNISRIFGELITLIEEDKRLGEVNEVLVKLPYSRKTFGVPTNLYLIGTMNTADRSITLIDTALRRRFEFIEMTPQPNLLPKDVDGVNVQMLVQKINERIEYLYDREHTIGHSYFLGRSLSEKELLNIMQKKILPLLQEYFYDDWEKIELILGGAAINEDLNYFIKKETIKPVDIFMGMNVNRMENQIKYSIVQSPTKEALLNVYKGKND